MPRLRRLTIPLLALVLAAAGAAAADPSLIAFRLKDQHDRLHTDARYRGAPLLVLWGDRKGADVMRAWAPALADSFAAEIAGYRLRLVQVAHGKGAPFFVKGKIKGSFRDPDTGPVLMDWDGVFAAAYAPEEDRVNAWLFDRDATLVATWRGAPGDSLPPADLLAAARNLAR
ncbi:MAG TPA: hypothetical protein PLQ13_04595 [Candidatus Krumholzibacteria bacterium]|nr:hypothetical protein [Candidatus Krumholzibacteria bacterium]